MPPSSVLQGQTLSPMVALDFLLGASVRSVAVPVVDSVEYPFDGAWRYGWRDKELGG